MSIDHNKTIEHIWVKDNDEEEVLHPETLADLAESLKQVALRGGLVVISIGKLRQPGRTLGWIKDDAKRLESKMAAEYKRDPKSNALDKGNASE